MQGQQIQLMLVNNHSLNNSLFDGQLSHGGKRTAVGSTRRLQRLMAAFWTTAVFSGATSRPRLPRLMMMASAAPAMLSKWRSASMFSTCMAFQRLSRLRSCRSSTNDAINTILCILTSAHARWWTFFDDHREFLGTNGHLSSAVIFTEFAGAQKATPSGLLCSEPTVYVEGRALNVCEAQRQRGWQQGLPWQ